MKSWSSKVRKSWNVGMILENLRISEAKRAENTLIIATLFFATLIFANRGKNMKVFATLIFANEQK